MLPTLSKLDGVLDAVADVSYTSNEIIALGCMV